MSEKEPGKGWFQQDQQRRQRPWGGNEPVFQEVQRETKVLAGECGCKGAWVQGRCKSTLVWVTADPGTTGKGHSCQGQLGAQAGFNLQIQGSRANLRPRPFGPRLGRGASPAPAGCSVLLVPWVRTGRAAASQLSGLSGLWVLH